jgi:transcription antitermination factor NusA-like protein
MSEKVKILRDVKILQIIDSGVILIIANRGDAAKVVGKDGYIVKALAKEFKKSIRVLEEAPEFKKFVQDLISPTIVQGINTLYTQSGTVYRIRVPLTQKNRLSIDPENISQILEDVYNKKAEIVFD